MFDDPAKLKAFVLGFYQVQAVITDLTDTADQKLAKALAAVNAQFGALGAKAKEGAWAESYFEDRNRDQFHRPGCLVLRALLPRAEPRLCAAP